MAAQVNNEKIEAETASSFRAIAFDIGNNVKGVLERLIKLMFILSFTVIVFTVIALFHGEESLLSAIVDYIGRQ